MCPAVAFGCTRHFTVDEYESPVWYICGSGGWGGGDHVFDTMWSPDKFGLDKQVAHDLHIARLGLAGVDYRHLSVFCGRLPVWLLVRVMYVEGHFPDGQTVMITGTSNSPLHRSHTEYILKSLRPQIMWGHEFIIIQLYICYISSFSFSGEGGGL